MWAKNHLTFEENLYYEKERPKPQKQSILEETLLQMRLITLYG